MDPISTTWCIQVKEEGAMEPIWMEAVVMKKRITEGVRLFVHRLVVLICVGCVHNE
jgi:hypothetical protein